MLNRRVAYILFIFVIIIILCIPNTRRVVYRITGDFFYPFISMVSNIGGYLDKKSDLSKSKTELIDEIVALRKKNTILAVKSTTIDMLRRENVELHRLLKLKSNSFYNYIYAEIISRDPVLWFQQFTINKGINDGLKNGALVIARTEEKGRYKKNIQFAVVGRISAVSNHSAVVDTIINEDCRLSVIVPQNGATGILSGGGRSGTQLWSNITYLPRDLNYKAGSVVQTSGLNDFIPPALRVGKIMGKNKANVTIYNDLYTKAQVKPDIDFNHLKFVLILVKNE
jgi:rod shape-determining protein MreC